MPVHRGRARPDPGRVVRRIRFVHAPPIVVGVRVPVTARMDEAVVASLDESVRAGRAETRAALVETAVTEWLDRHSEEAIVASYRRAYAEPDPEHEALLEALSAHSARVILSDDDAPG